MAKTPAMAVASILFLVILTNGFVHGLNYATATETTMESSPNDEADEDSNVSTNITEPHTTNRADSENTKQVNTNQPTSINTPKNNLNNNEEVNSLNEKENRNQEPNLRSRNKRKWPGELQTDEENNVHLKTNNEFEMYASDRAVQPYDSISPNVANNGPMTANSELEPMPATNSTTTEEENNLEQLPKQVRLNRVPKNLKNKGLRRKHLRRQNVANRQQNMVLKSDRLGKRRRTELQRRRHVNREAEVEPPPTRSRQKRSRRLRRTSAKETIEDDYNDYDNNEDTDYEYSDYDNKDNDEHNEMHGNNNVLQPNMRNKKFMTRNAGRHKSVKRRPSNHQKFDDNYDQYDEKDDDYYYEDNDYEDYDDYYNENQFPQGEAADVTTRKTNRRAKFSDKQSGSSGVTTGSANGNSRTTRTHDDVKKQKEGVGGKSMNEHLTEIFKHPRQAELFPLGECDLVGLNLLVQCGGNMFSVCASPMDTPIKIFIEGADGGGLLSKQNTVMYGTLRENAERRKGWHMLSIPDVSLMSPNCSTCSENIPVLTLQSGSSECRYSVNCLLRRNEAYTMLPSVISEFSACRQPPVVYTKITLTAANGKEIEPGTKVQLGEHLSLGVQSEADLTDTSLRYNVSSDGNVGLDLHLYKCWVGDQQNERASLLKSGCSIVNILTKLSEYTEQRSKFASMKPDENTAPNNESTISDKFDKKANKENVTAGQIEHTKENVDTREQDDNPGRTLLAGRVLTSKVVQKANLVAFVMNLADKVVDITCHIKVCIGECSEMPPCVASTVNIDKGKKPAPPIYTFNITLTVSMTPNTAPETTTEAPVGTPSNEQSNRNQSNVDTNGSTDSKRERRSIENTQRKNDDESSLTKGNALDSAATNKPSNFVDDTTASSAEVVSTQLNTRNDTVTRHFNPTSDCVPWWIFMLSLGVLTVIYIIALIGCVFLTNHSNRNIPVEECDVMHTPSRSYFHEQSSARKRTPPVFSERYLY